MAVIQRAQTDRTEQNELMLDIDVQMSCLLTMAVVEKSQEMLQRAQESVDFSHFCSFLT